MWYEHCCQIIPPIIVWTNLVCIFVYSVCFMLFQVKGNSYTSNKSWSKFITTSSKQHTATVISTGYPFHSCQRGRRSGSRFVHVLWTLFCFIQWIVIEGIQPWMTTLSHEAKLSYTCTPWKRVCSSGWYYVKCMVTNITSVHLLIASYLPLIIISSVFKMEVVWSFSMSETISRGTISEPDDKPCKNFSCLWTWHFSWMWLLLILNFTKGNNVTWRQVEQLEFL